MNIYGEKSYTIFWISNSIFLKKYLQKIKFSAQSLKKIKKYDEI